MKIARIAALVVPAALMLAGCSGNADDTENAANAAGDAPQAVSTTEPADGASSAPAAGGTASQAATGSGSAASPSAVPGADTAQVKVTKCATGKNGVQVEVDVKNTTDKPRDYVIAFGVNDSAGKSAGGGAVITQVGAGKSAKATGDAAVQVKGKVTCEITNIGSVEG